MRVIILFVLNNNSKMVKKRCLLGLGAGVVLVIICIAIVVPVVLLKRTTEKKRFSSAGSALAFFGTDDAMKIKWYHGANSQKKLREAISQDYMMIEGDIQLRWSGYDNATREPIMAHPPLVNSDLTLDEWLTKIFQRTDKAPKLDFKSIEVVKPSLIILSSKKDMIDHPVWANADVVVGPGGRSEDVIEPARFLQVVNEVYPKMTLSLGWTTGCFPACTEPFTQDMMIAMWNLCQNLTQPVTFPARAALLRRSWPQFKWLLKKVGDKASITVWTPRGRDDWEGTSIYDMLYIRNDIDKKFIYYDLPGPRYQEFIKLSVTAGSPLNHFTLPRRDALLITWAHRVNSKEALHRAISENLMFLEADVLLRGQGTANQTDVPVMAHPPEIDSDITLEEWLQKVATTKQGIKLDFKSAEVLEPAMKILKKMKHQLQQPVWLNADIFQGPNTDNPGVNATIFKQVILENFPESTLSPGWTTGWSNSINDTVYTQDMVDKMANFLQPLQQPVTFPVRAAMLKRSWDILKGLLNRSRSYTLTVWSSKADNIDVEDLIYVRKDSEIDRIYYDLPEPLNNEFKRRLGLSLHAIR